MFHSMLWYRIRTSTLWLMRLILWSCNVASENFSIRSDDKNDTYYTLQYSLPLALARIANNVKCTRSKNHEFCCVIGILFTSFSLGAKMEVSMKLRRNNWKLTWNVSSWFWIKGVNCFFKESLHLKFFEALPCLSIFQLLPFLNR